MCKDEDICLSVVVSLCHRELTAMYMQSFVDGLRWPTT